MAVSYKPDHIHLRSLDAPVAAAFYVDAMGATEITRMEVNGALRIILDLGGMRLFVEQVPAGTHAAALDAVAAQLERFPGELEEPVGRLVGPRRRLCREPEL